MPRAHRGAGGRDHPHRRGLRARPSAPCSGTSPASGSTPGPTGRRPKPSAASRPPPRASCGPATPCTGRSSPGARPTCSPSSTTTPERSSAIAGGCPRTRSASRRRSGRARGTWRARAGLCRQRLRHSLQAAAAGVRQPRGPPRALQARSTAGPGKDRARLRDGADPVPSRGRGPAARRTWPSSTGCSAPGSRPSITAASIPRPARRPSTACSPADLRCCPAPRRCTRRSCGPRSAR